MAVLVSEGNEPFTVRTGDRTAQLVVVPYLSAECVVVDDLGETDRGGRGFGSSGIK